MKRFVNVIAFMLFMVGIKAQVRDAFDGIPWSALFVFFLWFLCESVADGEQGITAHRVSPSLCAALSVNAVAQTADLTEKVVTTEFHDPTTLLERLGKRGIPI